MIKKIKCKICNAKFQPTQTYVVQESQSVCQALTTPVRLIDAMDCPNCGCQILLGIRLPKVGDTE